MVRRGGRLAYYANKAILAANSGYTVITTDSIYRFLKTMNDLDINWANIPKPKDGINGKSLSGIVFDEVSLIENDNELLKKKWVDEQGHYNQNDFEREYQCVWEVDNVHDRS